ncbi:ABC transporter permease [Inquilinus limosus]|uniref:Peptide ABC transporter permease n=1 Tax=Inquilinus limosus TaxID=171674 RepID=A0A211ZV56_9PROT|nr:ABC transporter permease [Inquilinus limosus]OWJ69178.1 peptide ABC transporter permease [Inquilinus limosus]
MPYFLRRLLGAALVVFGALTVVFLVLFWLPGDPAALIAGEDASAETIERIRDRLGTDRPLWEQYAAYLQGLARGDLGTSFSTGEPVFGRLWAQVPSTLVLTCLSCAVAIVVGIGAGVTAAVNRDGWVDQAIQAATLFLTSMPSFWLGILLILVFSVTLQWLPAIGSGSLKQLVLPVACLGLIAAGKLARMVRDSVLDVLDEPFVTTLRGKGLRERQVLYRHVLRNALIPVVTLLGILTGELLSGAVVTETLFARQGVGRILVEAVGVKDIPVVQGVILFVSVIYVLINLLVDLSYGWIDRRVRP